MKKSLIIIGVILLVAAGVWKFGLSRTWTQRITSGWNWAINAVIDQAYPDPTTNKLPDTGNDKVSSYDRHIEIIPADNIPAGAIMLKDTLVTKSISTGKVTYQTDLTAPVDPENGAFTQPEYKGQYFVFPRSTQKATYNIHQANIPGIKVAFEKEESVEGMLTYLFSYSGAYTATSSNPPLPAGQITKCQDDQFIQRFWVEPMTGEIVKMEWGCLTGLYVYDTAAQKYLNPVARWHGISTGDDVLRQVGKIQDQRTLLVWVATYIPLSLLVIGLLLAITGIILLIRKSPMPATVPTGSQTAS